MREEMFAALRRLTAELGDRAASIAGVGGAATAAGLVLLDGAGQPVRPGILWNDDRAVSTLTRWETDGLCGDIFATSGNVPTPAFTLALPDHLQRCESDLMATTDHILGCKDWLRNGPTGGEGSTVTDPTKAGRALGCIRTGRFNDRLIDRFGLAWARRLLPDVVESYSIAGTVSTQVAVLTGPQAGVPVVAGVSDCRLHCIAQERWLLGAPV